MLKVKCLGILQGSQNNWWVPNEHKFVFPTVSFFKYGRIKVLGEQFWSSSEYFLNNNKNYGKWYHIGSSCHIWPVGTEFIQVRPLTQQTDNINTFNIDQFKIYYKIS